MKVLKICLVLKADDIMEPDAETKVADCLASIALDKFKMKQVEEPCIEDVTEYFTGYVDDT